MKLCRIRRKGKLDEYEVREGGDGNWNGTLVATLRRCVLSMFVSRTGWEGEEFGGGWEKKWHPSLGSALRFYEQKKIDDRLFAKMEAVL